ncbi:MAG: SDR family NAD(P)-dependent oxidoreductase [Phycisphaera sp.]|nr:MAG: SDR family NAD(P)-dependent oxidoreductase [Phycisphaera sp.]
MAIDLTGKPIAITGASSGIGKATALACARAGMPVALCARRVNKLEDVAREIEQTAGTAIAVQTDVTSIDQCRAFIEKAEAELGPLYAVFANAGFGFERPIHETTDDQMREIFEANFFGTLNTIHPAVERFVERRAGHVLICSSSIGKMAIPGYGAYCATKAAQWHVGRAMRHELKSLGIHVSTVHPIGTRTEFSQGVQRRSGGSDIVSNTPKAFIQPPERVARAVVACLNKPKTEVWTSLPSRLGLGALSTFPRLADAAFDRFARKQAPINRRG